MCTKCGASAAFRRACDAQSRRGHGVESSRGDLLATRLALPVGSRLELAECGVDLEQCFAQRTQEGVDLSAFGRDLTGVGKAVVVRVAINTERPQLTGDPLALGGQLGASVRVRGGLGHGVNATPGMRLQRRARRPFTERWTLVCARGCAASYAARSRSGDTFVYTCVVEMLAWPSSSCTTLRSAP